MDGNKLFISLKEAAALEKQYSSHFNDNEDGENKRVKSQLVKRKLNLNFYEDMILNEELQDLDAIIRRRAQEDFKDRYKKAYISKKNKGEITKDFVNAIKA